MPRLNLLPAPPRPTLCASAGFMYSHLLDCGGADGPPTPSCVASRPSAAAAAAVAGIVPPALAATPSPEPLSASEWGSCEAAPLPSPSPCETANGRPFRVRCPRALPEGFSPDGGGEQDSGDEAVGHATGERTATRKFRGVWCGAKATRDGRCARSARCPLATLTLCAFPRARLDRKRNKCAPTSSARRAARRLPSGGLPCPGRRLRCSSRRALRRVLRPAARRVLALTARCFDVAGSRRVSVRIAAARPPLEQGLATNCFFPRAGVQGRTLFLGSHTDEDEAARACVPCHHAAGVARV